MGPSESPTGLSQNQASSRSKRRRRLTRRPRIRRCLLKGCEKSYRPQQALQRYCSPECREAARAWSRWKAQQRYRATATGQQKRRAQCRRYRERVPARRERLSESDETAARVITINFFRGLLRPARLLPGIRPQPEITAPAVLFERVPRGPGARPGAGTAMAGGAATIQA